MKTDLDVAKKKSGLEDQIPHCTSSSYAVFNLNFKDTAKPPQTVNSSEQLI